MTGDIREYARLGLVHHMLYPRCTADPDYHVRTLREFVERDDIETFDYCFPPDPRLRVEAIPAVRDCGKTNIAYATHLFPFKRLSFCLPGPDERAEAWALAEDMIDAAVVGGAEYFVFASGGPTPAEAGAAHREAFRDFCIRLCSRLKPHGILALLEPFDTTVDKKYLYGSTRDCVDVIESLRSGTGNLGIELDLAHVPLMGESFEQAIRTTAPHLERVHLGNCVLRNTDHPLYGDTHPPIGIDGGEIDVPEVAEILGLLLEIGFLDRDRRGSLVVEMTPWPGRGVEETVRDSFERLAKAWDRV